MSDWKTQHAVTGARNLPHRDLLIVTLNVTQTQHLLVEAKTQLGFRYASLSTELSCCCLAVFLLSPTITVGF
jgi:hypothetical protein